MWQQTEPLTGATAARVAEIDVRRVIGRVCEESERGVLGILGLLVLAIVLITLDAVVYRYGLDAPLSWTEQVCRILFVWMTFLGAAILYRRGMHIAVDLLLLQLPEPLRRAVSIVNETMMLVLFVVLLVFGLALTIDNVEQTYGALDVSPSIFYAAAPVSAALMIVYWVERLFVKRSWAKPPEVVIGH